jgi:uncharacterized membrane protein
MLFFTTIYIKMEVIHDFESKNPGVFNNGYQVKTESYIRRGWELLRMRTDYFVLFTLVFFVVSSIPLLDILLIGPLSGGFLLVAHYLASGKQVIFDDFFHGFKHFAGLFLFTIVSFILIFLGFLAFILPGIYLLAGYIFAPFFIVFSRMDFWEAMEASRKLVHRQWFSIFGFLIVLVLINFVGVLLLGIGLLITVPLSYCAMYAAFDDIVGVSN